MEPKWLQTKCISSYTVGRKTSHVPIFSRLYEAYVNLIRVKCTGTHVDAIICYIAFTMSFSILIHSTDIIFSHAVRSYLSLYLVLWRHTWTLLCGFCFSCACRIQCKTGIAHLTSRRRGDQLGVQKFACNRRVFSTHERRRCNRGLQI